MATAVLTYESSISWAPPHEEEPRYESSHNTLNTALPQFPHTHATRDHSSIRVHSSIDLQKQYIMGTSP